MPLPPKRSRQQRRRSASRSSREAVTSINSSGGLPLPIQTLSRVTPGSRDVPVAVWGFCPICTGAASRVGLGFRGDNGSCGLSAKPAIRDRSRRSGDSPRPREAGHVPRRRGKKAPGQSRPPHPAVSLTREGGSSSGRSEVASRETGDGGGWADGQRKRQARRRRERARR